MAVWIILFISALLIQSSAMAQTFTETWTGYTVNGSGQTVSADHDWNKNGGCYLSSDPPGDFILGTPYNSFIPTTDPCNPSDRTITVTNVIGDDNSQCEGRSTWTSSAGGTCSHPSGCYPQKHRAEVIPQNSTIRPDYNTESWLGWRIFVPSNYPNPVAHTFIVTQGICPSANGGVDWDLRIHTNGQWRHTQRRTVATPTEQRNDQTKDVGAVQRGTWSNFVHRWYRRIDNTGIGELWLNGVKVYSYSGISTQSTNDNCLVKHGLYHGSYIPKSEGGVIYQLMFDDYKSAYGSNQYATVAPTKAAGACSVPDPGPEDFPMDGNDIIDNFNDGDENPVNPSIWTQSITGATGNQSLGGVLVRIEATVGESYITAPMKANQEVYARLPNISSTPSGIGSLRLFGCLQGGIGTGTVDGYEIRIDKVDSANDIVRIGEMTNGVFSQSGSDISQEIVNTNKLGLRVSSGGNLDGFADTGSGWTSLGTRNDGSPLDCENTNIGVRLAHSSHQVDDFGGGPYVSSNNNNLLLNPIIFFD